MTKDRLLEIYSCRVDLKEVATTEQLEALLAADEKRFYFALMLFFLEKTDLSWGIRWTPQLANAVTLFCKSCALPAVNRYYSKYINLKEIPTQIKKIAAELKQIDG